MTANSAHLEDEMCMFEEQIGDRVGSPAPPPPPPPLPPQPPVIAANTFSSVQDRLSQMAPSGGGPARSSAHMFLPHQLSRPGHAPLPPPPPPPPPPEIPGLGTDLGAPPPPPPGYVPPFPGRGGPPRPPMMGYVPPPPGFLRPAMPPNVRPPPPGWRPPPARPIRPLQATSISSGPKVYTSKPQLKRTAASSGQPAPEPAPVTPEQPTAFTLAPPRKTKATTMAAQVAASITTVLESQDESASTAADGEPSVAATAAAATTATDAAATAAAAAAEQPEKKKKQKGDGSKKSQKPKKPKKFMRTAGGQIWEDKSLQAWDTDDFRVFAGDLGNDVTEDVLIRYFSVYPSFQRAKVVRDKRTNKTKGYGFLSFKESDDYVRAIKEMNGKYVGSRPIKLRKSSWRERQVDVVRKKERERAAFGLT